MTDRQINLIKDALLTVERRELKALKSLDGEGFEPSQAYCDHMQRLIRKETHWTRPFVRNKTRKTLTLLVAATLIIASLLSVSAIREPIVKYMKTAYEKFTHFFFEEDSSEYDTIIETSYAPTWIPEEYLETSVEKTLTHIRYKWDKNDDRIFFSQKVIGINSVHLNTEMENYTPMERNGQIYYYNESVDVYCYIWTIDNYAFNLVCENMEKDDVLKILDSIQPVPSS
ncbi:MAG: DUF4367 domain-containing protein [Clostridia bacterium]|nr:DUF4367 domain-containing protein [Clostridia bacterium]